MTAIQRYRVRWSGFPGAPGISTFYFTAPTAPAADLHALYAGIATHLPSNTNISFDAGGDLIDDTNGALAGSWTAAGAASIPGGSTGTYAGPVGACIDWLTGSVINRRRLMGRTFFVPLSSTSFDTDGSLSSTVMTDFVGAMNTFLGTSTFTNMLIWHRPKGASPGASHPATGGRVPDKAVVLRSRRA